MVDRGLITEDEARSHPRKNVIMRAVGLERTIRSDIFRLDIRPGDALLLCSDGLSNLVEAGEMESLLLASSDDDAVCRALLRMALDRGAPDNVTLALVRDVYKRQVRRRQPPHGGDHSVSRYGAVRYAAEKHCLGAGRVARALSGDDPLGGCLLYTSRCV